MIDDRARVNGHILSVVVPCLNEEKYLPELFTALDRQERPPDEVIVVESGSTDASVEVIRAAGRVATSFPIRLIEQPGGSIPANMNAGVMNAVGDVIVRLDAHSMPSPNYIRDALTHLQDPAVGVVGGMWNIAPGSPTATARAIARAVSHPLGAGDATYRIGLHLSAPATVDTVPFGCFRRALWDELGGFDDRLHANEDYDFNYRTRLTGRCVFLDPKIRSTYFARPTLTALAGQYLRYGWWKVQMLRKYPESLRWRQAVPAGFVAALVLLTVGSVIAPAVWRALAVVLAIYGATVAGSALTVTIRERDWPGVLPLIAAFTVVHVAWGTGFLLNLLTSARWPYTVPVAQPRESTTPVV